MPLHTWEISLFVEGKLVYGGEAKRSGSLHPLWFSHTRNHSTGTQIRFFVPTESISRRALYSAAARSKDIEICQKLALGEGLSPSVRRFGFDKYGGENCFRPIDDPQDLDGFSFALPSVFGGLLGVGGSRR